MMLRAGLFALVVAGICISLPALAGSPKAQAAPTKKGLGTLEQKAPVATQASEAGIQALPAPEVVKLRCPSKLTYYSDQVASSSELAGWGTPKLSPGKMETTFRFNEIRNLQSGSWQGATSIECLYSVRLEKKSYTATVTRKVHPSGTPYRCKVRGNHGPEVECRLSITPDF